METEDDDEPLTDSQWNKELMGIIKSISWYINREHSTFVKNADGEHITEHDGTFTFTRNPKPIKIEVIRVQFTRFNEEQLPEIKNNADYLDFETVNTGLSEAICSYGYQLREYISSSKYSCRWITRDEAILLNPDIVKSNRNTESKGSGGSKGGGAISSGETSR